MTLAQFTALSYTDQLTVVNETGTYLATRWQEATLVLLYRVPGAFFVAVSYDTTAKRLSAVRAFASTASLEAFASSIRFTEGLEGLEGA